MAFPIIPLVLGGLLVGALAFAGKAEAREAPRRPELPAEPPTDAEVEDAHQEALALVDQALEDCPAEEERLLQALDAFALLADRDPDRALSSLEITIAAICGLPATGESGHPAIRAGQILDEARRLCPTRSADINAISGRFGAEVLFDPAEALRKLEAELALVCPAALTAMPPAVGPEGFPTPEDVAEDFGIEATAEALAQKLADEARRIGCENVSPELVGAFQQAGDAIGIPNLSPPDGLYDFVTAAAVARFVQKPPPPCRFGAPPGTSPEAIEKNADRWSEILENLGAESPGWPEISP